MNEPVFCTYCNAEIEGESVLFEEAILCEECYENETFRCTYCEERFWNDDNAGNDNTPLCAHCYDYHYSSCYSCGRLIRNDDAHYQDDEDEPYCYTCFCQLEENPIHEYSYKPDPIFYGSGNRFFGVELELDDGGKLSSNAEQLLTVANAAADHLYIKGDGSLNDGLELVTHPMSLAYHTERMPWGKILATALDLGYQSHKTSTCGLHVHVNRTAFGGTVSQQEACIGRVLFFVERFWEEMLRFSRRTESQIKRWAARYGYKDKPMEILDHAKNGYGGRYTCINLTNYETIEFRIFRGTLKLQTIIATLQMIEEICNVALFMSDEELKAKSWCELMERINPVEYPQLIAYLKERRLYINEPVAIEEDC